MASYSTNYDNGATRLKLFGRGQRSVHAALGGGKVADLLLWRNKRVSGAVLSGVAVVWFLFEVVEYNFITLLCHLLITAMLVLFIWSVGAEIFRWTPPNIPKLVLKDSTFRELASTVHKRFNQFLSLFLYVACGNDAKLFFLGILSLWFLGQIGNYINTLNLVFFGLLCIETLPFLYDRYEEEFDDLAGKVYKQMRRTYRKVEADVLEKIPRGPVKEKKKA
ncbi:OLC1v1014128C1 [Oldenlandia corymbosa var. corymbosa]|uniref:Reticulon-like protein n=1 Tax=Oldenlandia corymbosa var. corymbosa TaxID=529605 RepID=A0AAV1E0B9_OLDCO|nr:OLC1v1014128C1 [Oldenlandia corymbosa var. corymbosa]